MLFIVVKFVTLLVLTQSLYAAPIGESVGTSIIRSISTNDNVVSRALTTETVDDTCTSHRNLDERQHEAFKCCWETCNQSFDSVTGLSKHIDKSHIVRGQKYYNCEWENFNYDSYLIANLQRHLCKHAGERPFVCSFDGCGLSFAKKSNLKEHIKAIHLSKAEINSPLKKVEQQAVLHCDWKNCNRDFDNTTSLTNHIKTRHIVKWDSRYECQWKDCSYATCCKTNIEMHIRTHAMEQPFICSYNNCGKSFSLKGNLKRHLTRTELISLSDR